MKYFKCKNEIGLIKVNTLSSSENITVYLALCKNDNFIEISKQEHDAIKKNNKLTYNK